MKKRAQKQGQIRGLSPQGTVPNTRQRCGGYVLITVIVMLVVVAVITFLVSYDSSLKASMPAREAEASRADYVAEAAMQHALWQNNNNACAGDFSILSSALGQDSYSAAVTGGGSTTSHNLAVDQDAWIRNDDVTKNNGGTADQHIRFETGNIEHALTRFNLAALPAGAQINSATAWFYVTTSGPGGGAHPDGPLTIHRVTADWTELGATWDTMNGNFESSRLATIPAQPQDGVWVSINLTAQVQAWVNGQANYGILMAATAEGVHGKYASREDGSKQPRLDVVVGSGPASPVAIQATGTLSNGVLRALTRSNASAYQPSGGASLEPVADVYLKQDAASLNFGAAWDLWVEDPGAGGSADTSLLRFNLGLIPRGARVTSATLEVYAYLDASNSPGSSIGVHRVSRDWVAGTNNGGSGSGATWNDSEPGTSWSSGGGDYDVTAIGTEDAAPNTTGWRAWDVTDLVNGWSSGTYPNQGLILVAENDSTLVGFRSSDYSNASLRPKLTITYACECGSACLAPQGSGKVLMVVINPTTLVAADANKKALFESWGYTVNVVGESENAAAYSAAAAANDVVFISETVNSNQVGTKLVNVPIGVVSQDGAYNVDLGFAGGSSWTVNPSINVTDASHYITAVFPTGPLDIYSGGMEQLVVSGGAAGGLGTLADTGGAGSLVVLDTGAALFGGGNAAGRRVMLPLGRDSSLNWAYLNNNGRLLVQRALAWGMNADAAPGTAGKLLLVVGNAASPASKDSDRNTLIESWGYTVTLIDDGDSQANFDAAAAANDVIYVTDSIADGTLAAKLTNSTVGIVNEEGLKLDDFGFGSQVPPNTVTTNLFQTNATHYISEPFGGADVTHFTANIGMPHATGTLAPGIQSAASWSTLSALPTLDTGAERWDGAPSAGRRVNLPFGAANISQLTADGLTLMKRAIEWGASAPSTPLPGPLLFVVPNAASLSSQDSARKALIESWGYTVTNISANASQANYNTALAAVDVVYISELVSSSDIGTKLTDTTVGVVSEEWGLVDELGIAQQTLIQKNTTNFQIVDNTHYVTSGFNLGALALYSSAQSIWIVGGSLAPGLQLLGETEDTPSVFLPGLALLDAGADLYGGGFAAGRRVQLPWAGGATFDINALTDDGRTTMKRAIEWGAGAGGGGGGGGGGGPIAHWMLDDGTGLSAIDSEGGHHGTLTTGGPVWVAGTIGDALDFDGANDYVDLTSDAELDDVFVGGATVMAWIEPASWGGNGYGRIFDKSSVPASTGDGWAIRLNKDNGGLNFGQGFTSGRGWWRFAESSINFNTWHHVALAYDASSTTNDPIVYLDGSPLAVTRVDTPSGTIRSDAAINLRLGSNATSTLNPFDGKIDDARIYDRMLDAAEIAAAAAGGGGGGGGGGSSYVEKYQPWTASGADTWQTVDLSGYGVPADAVVEVAVTNSNTGREYWGGVRAVGSSLNRRFLLHEAEGDGVDAVVMHVQADASSQIQHYSDITANVTFTLLGYWTGAAYVERFDIFTAPNSSWSNRNLAPFGVGAGDVAEIVMANKNPSAERYAGVRTLGSGLVRRVSIHEAESGGIDAATMLVGADSSSNATIQVQAEAAGDVDFYLVGYWSTPPGTFTEAGGVSGQVSALLTWEPHDVSTFGVPAGSVAQFMLTNDTTGADVEIGVRQTGSSLNRRFNIQEAESGGSDIVTMHVNVDASSGVEWYAQYGGLRFFHPLGWWVLN